MLHHQQEYDRILEAYSKPLRTVVSISIDADEKLTINNPIEASGSYRYPDLTNQVHYLLNAVEQTINTELETEILFIRSYDRAKDSISEVVDMPKTRLNLLIKLHYQSKGTLSKGKRDQFSEITDDELARIELAFQAAFADQTLELDT
ncbi:MAG: Fic family protein [Pseudoduganella sp.]|nr:Fic family protein [Pseudoduganella sp.]